MIGWFLFNSPNKSWAFFDCSTHLYSYVTITDHYRLGMIRSEDLRTWAKLSHKKWFSPWVWQVVIISEVRWACPPDKPKTQEGWRWRWFGGSCISAGEWREGRSSLCTLCKRSQGDKPGASNLISYGSERCIVVCVYFARPVYHQSFHLVSSHGSLKLESGGTIGHEDHENDWDWHLMR